MPPKYFQSELSKAEIKDAMNRSSSKNKNIVQRDASRRMMNRRGYDYKTGKN